MTLGTIRVVGTISETASTSADTPFLSHDSAGIGAVGKEAGKKWLCFDDSRVPGSSRAFRTYQIVVLAVGSVTITGVNTGSQTIRVATRDFR